jgi:hypothetical protein
MTPAPANLIRARQVADAVLYEGYLLYPYRASSAKNQVRWQFGVLGPEGAHAAGVGEPAGMSTEIAMHVAPGDSATVDVCLRFLHVQARTVERKTPLGWAPTDELTANGSRWIPFHEAAPHEIAFSSLPLDELSTGSVLHAGVPAHAETEELFENGKLVGRLIRTRWPLSVAVYVSSKSGRDPRLTVLSIVVENRTSWTADRPAHTGWSPRDLAARHSLVGSHLLVTAGEAHFLSHLDAPDWATADIETMTQSRCWPALIADDEGGDAVLVAPIILGDHPSIAPESAGDLFDATEIDEILTLRVMTMTDFEKAEARGTDPRAAAILARCDAMTDDAMTALHGGRRPGPPPDLREVPVYGDDVPWWDEGQDARAEPASDSVMVNGIPVARGSRVLLRPTRRADAQDLFLAGQTAVVTRVYFDVDGGTHVAVVLEDDPGSDLYDDAGRFYYFGPEEIEPLPAHASTDGASP